MNTTTIENISYKGCISITIKQHDKVIAKHTYHNKGGNQLFAFLSSCLVTDKYNGANAPRFLKFFTLADPTKTVADMQTINDNSAPVCAAIYYNASEVIETTDANGERHPAAYLHFTVPCSALTNTVSGNTATTIYQAGLYNANNASNEYKANYCAVFNFTDNDIWTPLTFSSANGDYNIFVDWTLSFSN